MMLLGYTYRTNFDCHQKIKRNVSCGKYFLLPLCLLTKILLKLSDLKPGELIITHVHNKKDQYI